MIEFYCDRQTRKYLSFLVTKIVARFPKVFPSLPVFPVIFLAALVWCDRVLAENKVAIDILDKATGNKVATRIEYTQPAGRGPKPRRSLSAGRYILFDEDVTLSPAPGAYEFTVCRGPEFQDVKAGFTIERNALDSVEIVVPHKTPMRLFGWYSGDLRNTLTEADLKRWMAAESLDIVTTTAKGNNTPLANSASNRDALTQESEAEMPVSPEFPGIPEFPVRLDSTPVNTRGEPDWTKTESPAPLLQIVSNSKHIDVPESGGIVIHRYQHLDDGPEAAIARNVEGTYDWMSRLPTDSKMHVEMTRPWERDVPIMLSTRRIDSIQLLSEHLKPDTAAPLSSSIRNPDGLRFKGKKGLGRLAEHIYWQMLEAGFRMPLTAGSGFTTKGDTFLGYNRVYAFLGERKPGLPDLWWRQLRKGATIVTNGPLLVPIVNGLPPGSTQVGALGQSIALDIQLNLTVRDPVEYLEVVFNGKSLYQARLEEHARRGAFPSLQISESGWLLLRVVTEHDQSYRMTTTSPYYFDFEGPRISRVAVKFFLDWLDESASKIRQDPSQTEQHARTLDLAKKFWSERLDLATTP